jgi:hypothetical protein
MSDPACADDRFAPAPRGSDRHYWRVDFEADELPESFLEAVLDALGPPGWPTPSDDAGAPTETPDRVAR